MEKKTMRRADLITSIILTIIGLWIAVTSLKMMLDVLAQGVGTWYSSPGLLPLLVSIFLIICSVSLFRVAIRDGAKLDFVKSDSIKALFKSQAFLGTLGIIVLLAIYIYVLLQILPYWFATFIFLFIFMVLFKGTDTKSLVKAAIIAAVTTAIITYGFGTLAMIPLP